MSETQKILFVCSQNQWRSLTAEKIYEGFSHYQARSAGTAERARVRVTDGHIGWADWIFVMEKKHIQFLTSKYGDRLREKKVVCLNIPDQYQFMDRELVDLLKSRLSQYIDVPQ
ncbi:protein tyrosine phosphatase [bacterium]|jgi:predicted protein tyrosine phosphatase|nr:protein tyrosine phosphatase [bacterium]